tara:strand:+ start:373 stop:573 length:201 start_codon:yes stop_codon:yes gene_type:complete
MPKLSHSQQIAMAVIIGQSSTSNAKAIAKEVIEEAEIAEKHSLNTGCETRPVRMIQKADGTVSFTF